MNYLHSGSLGDVIYSLPTVKAMNGRFNKANLYLRPGLPDKIPGWAGDRPCERMRRVEAEKLIPLLAGQPGLDEVALYENQPIDVDLDRFRDTGFDFGKGDITRYYCYAFKVCPRTWEPWLRVDPAQDYAGAVLVNRTNRYRNRHVSYGFLAGRPNVYFVGYPEEYKSFVQDCPRIPHIQAPDALTLARWIAGCKLFVGNQSFCFSLAEAMKTPRILEVFKEAPNVRPNGPKGYEAIGQKLFEEIVNDLAK